MKMLEAIHSRAARRASYALLLAALVITVLVHPVLFEAGLDMPWLVSVLFLLVLVGCLASAVEEAKWFGFLVVVVIVFEVLAGMVVTEVDTPSIIVHHALRALVLTVTVWVLLRNLIRSRRVTADMVLGAICVYFLLGMIWAQAYVVVEYAMPGSFDYPPGFAEGAWNPSRLTIGSQYFSFVTMTTLGYGDVVPTRALARSLSMLQAIAGQFYIAIVVARMVSLYVLKLDRDDDEA